MNRIAVLLIVTGSVSPSASALAAPWRAVESVPGGHTVTVSVDDKERTYFRVTRGAPLTLPVDGPARLRLITRVEIAEGGARIAPYRIRLSEGGRILKEHATESSPAAGVAIQGSRALVCKSRTVSLDVPAGSHSIAVSAADASTILIRPLVSSEASSDRPMISITPVEAFRSVTVSEGEKLIPYYTVLPGKPVTFRIVGPTDVELSSRLDFDATMRGSQSYRLAISERGLRIREVALRTTKASAAVYTDLKDRAASKASRTVLTLRDGIHELRVDLLEPRNGSAELHARVPQPQSGVEE